MASVLLARGFDPPSPSDDPVASGETTNARQGFTATGIGWRTEATPTRAEDAGDMIAAAIAPFTQTLALVVAMLAMISIGISQRRLEWRRRDHSEHRRRYWPWQKST